MCRFLENTIYIQCCLLFGTLPNKKKGLCGLNRRAHTCISLVQGKNKLLNQLNSSTDQGATLKPLLEHVQSRFRHLRQGESNRKKRWKIKEANTAFIKNPFNAGDRVLDLKCFIPLKCDIICLSNYKKSDLFDEHHQISLPPLEGLPPPPVLSCFSEINFKA